MNDRVVFVVLNLTTGEIDHVWESGHLPDSAITDQVPLVVHVHNENGTSSPSPDHAVVRVLECPDIDPQELKGVSRAEYIRQNFVPDGAPIDISASPQERLPVPGISGMSQAVTAKVRSKLSESGIREEEEVPADPEAAARKLRYVGALKRREN